MPCKSRRKNKEFLSSYLRSIALVLFFFVNTRITEVRIQRVNGPAQKQENDFLVREEPLEVRVESKNVAVVMRTPGDDEELAAGFLLTEGIVHDSSEILKISRHPHCLNANPGQPLLDGNAVNVHLKNPGALDFKKLTRHVFTSSSCGICSKATIDAVRRQFPALDDDCVVDADILFGLPQMLALSQDTFKSTGGLHACALFDLQGNLLVLREDVGRHNALDKVIGWALLRDRLPLRESILLLSGRASFEMLQKALAGGIPIIAAISAPSSLAVMFARESGQTLIGFLRNKKMNIYTADRRVCQSRPESKPSLACPC